MLYRVLTENVNRAGIERIVASHFDGFTIFTGIGYWKGSMEASLTIEIDAPEADFYMVQLVAIEIKELNNQECVMIQQFAVQTVMVETVNVAA